MLEQNFRSTQTILDAANAVIANNIGRQPKELFTVGRHRRTGQALPGRGRARRGGVGLERDPAPARVRGPLVGRLRRLLPHQRAVAAARDVHEVHRHPLQGGGRGQVLRPARDQGRPGLRPRPGQPRRRGLGPPHRERAQARHRRHVGGPARRLGPGATACPFSEAIDRAEEAGLSGKALRGAEQLSKTLAELRPLVQTVNPADFVQLVADRTGYLAELVAEHTHEADGRIENLAELASQAGDFDDVQGFLETVALVADSDELESDGTRVSLMTLHTAKGLEYPAVFVVGPGGGDLPALPLAGRADRARGGAPAVLCRHHPGPPAPGDLARLVAHDLGPHPARHAEPLRHRGARRTWWTTSGWARRGAARATTRLSGDEHLAGATFAPAVPLAPPPRPAVRAGRAGPRGSTGAEDLGLAPRRRGGARPLGPRRRGRAPRGRARGPRPRWTSTRWARRTCCSRPRRCGGPDRRVRPGPRGGPGYSRPRGGLRRVPAGPDEGITPASWPRT